MEEADSGPLAGSWGDHEPGARCMRTGRELCGVQGGPCGSVLPSRSKALTHVPGVGLGLGLWERRGRGTGPLCGSTGCPRTGEAAQGPSVTGMAPPAFRVWSAPSQGSQAEMKMVPFFLIKAGAERRRATVACRC